MDRPIFMGGSKLVDQVNSAITAVARSSDIVLATMKFVPAWSLVRTEGAVVSGDGRDPCSWPNETSKIYFRNQSIPAMMHRARLCFFNAICETDLCHLSQATE